MDWGQLKKTSSRTFSHGPSCFMMSFFFPCCCVSLWFCVDSAPQRKENSLCVSERLAVCQPPLCCAFPLGLLGSSNVLQMCFPKISSRFSPCLNSEYSTWGPGAWSKVTRPEARATSCLSLSPSVVVLPAGRRLHLEI